METWRVAGASPILAIDKLRKTILPKLGFIVDTVYLVRKWELGVVESRAIH